MNDLGHVSNENKYIYYEKVIIPIMKNIYYYQLWNQSWMDILAVWRNLTNFTN